MWRWPALLLVFVLAAVSNLLLWLASPWGAERTAGVAEAILADAFRGRVMLGSVAARGIGAWRVDRALLLDPGGAPSGSARRIRIDLRVLSLLRRRLVIRDLEVAGATVRIVSGDPEAGLPAVFLPPLARAPAPPRVEGEKFPPRAPFPIDLGSLRLSEVGFLLEDPRGEVLALAREIRATIRGDWEERQARVGLHLEAEAAVPVRGGLSVDLHTSLFQWKLDVASFSVSLGGTTVEGAAAGDVDELQGDVSISGRLSPSEARQIGIAIAGPLSFEGDVHLAEAALVDLSVVAEGGGRLRLEATAERFRSFRGEARFFSLDPSRWWTGAPEGRLSGRARFIAALGAEPSAEIRAILEKGEPIGPGIASLRLERGRVRLDELILDLPGARLHSRGELDGRRMDLLGRVRVFDLRLLRDRALSSYSSVPPLAGEGSLWFHLEGELPRPTVRMQGKFETLTVAEAKGAEVRWIGRFRPSPPEGELHLRGEAIAFRGLAWDGPEASFSLAPGGAFSLVVTSGWEDDPKGFLACASGRLAKRRVRGSAEVAATGWGFGRGEIDLPTSLAAAGPEEELRLDLLLDPVDPARAGRPLGLELPPGRVRARLALGGTVGKPRASGNVFVEELRPPIGGAPPALAFHLFGTLEDGRADIALEGWTEEAKLVEARASGPFSLAASIRDPRGELERALRSSGMRGELHVRAIDLSLLGPLAGVEGLEGIASADVDFVGPLQDPRGALRIDLSGGPLGPVRLVDGAVTGTFGGEEVRVDGELSLDGQAPIRLAAWTSSSIPRLLANPEASRISLRWSVDPQDLSKFPEAKGVAGVFRSEGSFDGGIRDLQGSADFDLRDFVFQGMELGSALLRVSLSPEAEVRLFAIDPEAGTLVASLTLEEAHPLALVSEGGPSSILRSRGRMHLEAASYFLRPLALLPSVVAAEGELLAKLDAEGRVEALFPSGAIEVRRGELQIVGGMHYERIALRSSLEEDRLVISSLEVHGARGVALAEGEVRGAPTTASFEVGFRSRAFPVGGEAGVVASISTEGRVVGGYDPEGVDVTVSLAYADLDLPEVQARGLQGLGPPEDVVVFGAEPEEGKERSRLVPPVDLRLEVARPVHLKGPDVDVSAEVALRIHRSREGIATATGSVRSTEGKATVFGRSFTIEPSTARWTEAPLGDPVLDVTARFQGASATAWVDIAGTLRAPVVTLRSDPPMSEAEVAALIASGGGQTPGLTPVQQPPGGQAIAAGAAASLVGSFAANRLRQALGGTLPIQVLTVEAVEGRAFLEAGTFLGTRLYVGYARTLLPEPGENANEARITYLLTQTLAVQSHFGDAANGGVDLVWTEHFPTAAQRRARTREPEAPPPGAEKPPTPLPGAGGEPRP